MWDTDDDDDHHHHLMMMMLMMMIIYPYSHLLLDWALDRVDTDMNDNEEL